MNSNLLNINTLIKIGLATLLFLCLLKMPYGYYQIVRFLATGVFIYFALTLNKDDKQYLTKQIVFISLAILFQPLFKIALGRTIWNIVDIIIGVALIVSIFFGTNKTAAP